MNATNLIQRSWWRRLGLRARAEAPRRNRLSHFEPLEQRTVLSASMFMPGGGDFFQTPHDVYRYDADGSDESAAVYEVAPQREFLGSEHFGPAPREEYADHDALYAPYSHSDGLMPTGGMLHEIPVEGEYAASSPTLVSPQLPRA